LAPVARKLEFELGLEGFLFAPSRSVPKISGERGGAFVFPRGGGFFQALPAPFALAQAKKWGKFGPDEVPFRRNPEQQNFTEKR
jgi:hypothetical protein